MPKPSLAMPISNKSNSATTLDCPNNVVIFGANGSGKSRLGWWIELQTNNPRIHRISAHRALVIPEFAPIRNMEESGNDLFFGNPLSVHATFQNKAGLKWNNQPVSFLQNDFEKVLSMLFASSALRNSNFVTHVQTLIAENKLIPQEPPPLSQIDKVIAVWTDIMPHRKIKLQEGKITAFCEKTEYKGGDMSDGEKVALYLLAQSLLVPVGHTVIVDEPELHLHKALMKRLWDSIEEARPDCLFVYITHDLDFAATRIDAKKIWVQEYKGNNTWVWGESASIPEIPESILLEVQGSRKPVLFVEGERNSLDAALFQLIYPQFYILPRGGCSSVISTTKALQKPIDGKLEAYGLIDRDFRTQAEIEAHAKDNIFVLHVAEIENLICTEAVLRIVIAHQMKPVDETLAKIISGTIAALKDELSNQASLMATSEIKHRLANLDFSRLAPKEIALKVQESFSEKTVGDLHAEAEVLLNKIISNNSYKECLIHFNRKNLITRVIAPTLGLTPKSYIDLVIGLAKDKKSPLIDTLRSECPQIPAVITPQTSVAPVGAKVTEPEAVV